VPDAKAFPVAQSYDEVVEQIKAVGNNDHEFKTLVIDSITKLARMLENEICEKEGKPINAVLGGYGSGYSWVAEKMAGLKVWTEKLAARKGMHIVFIGHESVETVTPADSEQYTRWSLRMHQKAVAPFIDDCDLVCHLRMNVMLLGTGDKKRAKSDGKRIIQITSGPGTVAKNRFGLTDDISFEAGTNPLIPLIPQLQEN
jgi:hypothetical protein